MKKLLSILFLLGLCFIPVPVHAAESGSLIVRTVAARLHSDKTITVTETLRLRLPGHDDYELFLNLPDNSQMKAEKVKLISEQAVLDPQWNRVQFNRDTDVELQLEYTLQLFQDENDQADTLTLNLASSPLDLPTEQLHVELQLDPELHRDNWILDCGQSGNQCRYGEGRWQDQTFVFDSDQVLDYQAVNLTLNFDEGTFASAPVYSWPFRYTLWRVEIEVLPQMDLQVHQEIQWLRQSDDLDPMLDLFLGWPSYPDAQLKEVAISDPMLEVSKYGFLKLPDTQAAELTLDYRIELTSLPDQWRLNFDDTMNQAQIDRLEVTVRMPQDLEVTTDFYHVLDYEDHKKMTMDRSEDGKLLHLSSTQALTGDDRVSLTIKIPYSMQRVMRGATGFWSMFAIGVLLAAGLFRGLNRSAKRRAVGELPNGVNPVQAALLTHRQAEGEMLAAVIVNWAARDYIQIQMDAQTLRLFRRRSLIHQPPWEKQFMHSLFQLGDGNSVTAEEISQRGQACVQQAWHQAQSEAAQWRHPGLSGLRWLLMLLSVLPPVILLWMQVQQTYRLVLAILLGGGLLRLSFILGSRILARKQGKKGSRIQFAGLALLWLILLEWAMEYFVLRSLPLAISYFSMAAVQVLLVPMKPLNPEGLRLRQQAVQWRQDLKQMPDKKLDEWLERDPEYALKSYGYARTLNVADVWEKRFYPRVLPLLETVVDAGGQPERIWVLDELYDRLQHCLKNE
ncbi:DUF2207 domain-containing protein [Holdemania massiliensis]|uniref:DUF2207 domain-containing protein n=1 Tax=Holdemania massiliensis TaxID=1468449 RepID=A0A6N7S2V9_9FIRM|nr:DUF2207 domain-containing protein [Holdemania massiliensis]MSA70380.1 DUF2207 domain-containing protein [Holdemania massiliensis]MSA88089.1 DUF2207 domain-containing protein [Holdemania massiliensis]MSB76918.1 DUF2207 domain-containing protein [Holdemania massiliensis]MSC31844.1 DUF2207 domain-containing protein [Holdemania massiliensis]